MTEILAQLTTEAKRFLDSDRDDIYREMSRTAIVNTDGVDIEIRQSKMISAEEMELVRESGPAALATPEWFRDVEWLQGMDEDRHSLRNLQLDAIYPPDYLDEEPSNGLYVSSGEAKRWQDQYGSISGFGSRGKINLWLPQFIAPGERTVTTLRYPDDPTAFDVYNARYLQYLDELETANPTIGYYRGWEGAYSHDADRSVLVIGRLSLGGFGIKEVLQRGSSSAEDQEDYTSIRLDYGRNRKKYVGRNIDITSEGAITEPYWGGEMDRKPASKKLLAATLKLVRDTTQQ